jgi:hypothetical protein
MTNDTIRKRFEEFSNRYDWINSTGEEDIAQAAFIAGYQAASTRNDAPVSLEKCAEAAYDAMIPHHHDGYLSMSKAATKAVLTSAGVKYE